MYIYYLPAHYMPVIQVLSSSNMEKKCFAYNSGLFTLVSAQKSQSWQPRFTKGSAPGRAGIQHLVRNMRYPGFLKDWLELPYGHCDRLSDHWILMGPWLQNPPRHCQLSVILMTQCSNVFPGQSIWSHL